MTTLDIGLYETGSGGDFALLNGDLMMSELLYQQIYLALFGGNIEASTKALYLDTEERFDYWGNSLIWKDTPTRQFNSETERLLREVALNGSSRIAILQAVTNDLEYLKSVIDLSIDVSILDIDKLQITITFTKKSNQQDKVLQLIYDNVKNEVIIQKTI